LSGETLQERWIICRPLLSGFVVSQQRPAATQARQRKPLFFLLVLCQGKKTKISDRPTRNEGSEERFFKKVLCVGKSGRKLPETTEAKLLRLRTKSRT
jgi:hypothetical protein